MDPNENPNIKLFQKGPKHYFSILGKDGKKAILTSKGYGAAKTRDNGFQTFIKNLDRLEQDERNDFFYFYVKTGNNQVIAKSVPFSSDDERQQATDFLMQVFEEQDNPASGEEKEKLEDNTVDLPPKYSFRLEFYVSEEQKPVRGKIEYPFTKEKKTFDGIDMQAIETFLKNYLPFPEDPAKPDTVTGEPPALGELPNPETSTSQVEARAPKERSTSAAATFTTPPPLKTDQKPAVPKVDHGIPIGAAATAIDFSFINTTSGSPAGWQLRRSGQTSIQLDVSKLEFPREVYTDLSVSVFGMPLETGRKQLLGSANFKSTEQQPRVPMHLHTLPVGGTCKFELLIKITAPGTEVPPRHLAVGSKTAGIAG